MKNTIILSLLVLMYAAKGIAQCNYNGGIQILDTVVAQACTQNGQIDVGVSGGTAPYTFAWSVGYSSTVIATSQDLTSYAGDYTLSVTDSHGNCNTIYVVLNGAFTLQASITEDTSCPVHSGTATIMGTGGLLPYSYLWSNGATTATITNLAGGNYDVTVTDGSGCQMVASRLDSSGIQISAIPFLNVNITGVNPTNCDNNNGMLTATVSNGTAPYIYVWGSYPGGINPGWTTAQLNNVPGGNVYYYLDVTDANGCTGRGYYDSLFFNSPIQLAITSTPQNCLVTNGTATVVANGITGPYSYLWNTGATTAAISALVQGNYNVTVTDVNSCTNSAIAIVSYYSPLQPNVSSANQICNYSLGTAEAVPTLGTAPYTYSWSNGSTADSLDSLIPGIYYVTITDNVGCTVSSYAYIELASAITPNETSTDQVCNGALGSSTLAPTGGVAPYTYLWSTGQTTASINNLQSGNYSYTITDVNGCQYTDGYVYINYNSGIAGEIYPNSYPTCQLANGSLYVDIWTGTPPYTYLWSNGSTSATPRNLQAGNYAVTITQTSNNCSVVKAISLTPTSPLTALINVTPATCIFTNDGSATVTLGNGTPPYNYQWGNGSVTATADSLDARWGIGVWVTDANGCWVDTHVNSVGYQNLSCAAIISGEVVDDATLACIPDNADTVLQNTYVKATPGYGTLTDVLGHYQIIVRPGNYAITQYAEYRNQGCPTGSITLNNCLAGSLYPNNDFYDWPLDVKDLRISFCDFEEPRPGYTHTIRVYYQNNGLLPVSNAVVSFIYDPGVSYAGGGSSVDLATYTVTINCGLLAPTFGWGYTDLSFTTPSSTALGTVQTYTANITPVTDDATPNNNTETAQYTVVSSYDPNNLSVAPQGSGVQGYITHNDSVLKYSIHFQNTGSFDASFIAIRDTLDPNLDPSSIQVGASSLPVTLQLEDNVLLFLFDPLYLPDSSDDPINSIGMVTFYIKQIKGLAAGTEIHNKASVYFDFNLPVLTNATLNTLTDSGSGIENIADGMSAQLVPNPTPGFTNLQLTLQNNFTGSLVISDLPGRNIYEQELNLQAGVNNIPLNLNQAASGMYLVYLSDGMVSKCLKLMKE